jgi:hypothetical protein
LGVFVGFGVWVGGFPCCGARVAVGVVVSVAVKVLVGVIVAV